MSYVIKEILECECDSEGFITVSFILDGDKDDTQRCIESVDYYYFAEEDASDKQEYFQSDWFESEDYNEEGFKTSGFNFIEWLDYEHCDEKVMEFIAEFYPTIGDLPLSEKN